MHTAENSQTAERGSIGRLMSPLEVYAATLSRSDIPSDIKHEWFLCADIPEPVWDALAGGAETVGFRLSAFATPVQPGYACFTLQVRQSQVRFLLQLGSKRIEWFLKDASLYGAYLSVSRNNSSKAIVKRFGVEPAHVAPVLDIAKRCRDLDAAELMPDFSLALGAVCRTSTIPSVFDGVAVNDAYIVAVSPQ